MKKFEINFYNGWYGFGQFDLFSWDIFTCKTNTSIQVTVFNFEADITLRTAKQIKEQKKWDKEMAARQKAWSAEVFQPDFIGFPPLTVSKKAKKTTKKVTKVAAKKRKTTK